MPNKVCSVPGCKRVAEVREMCYPHYLRVQRFGSPLPDKPLRKSNQYKLCKVPECMRQANHYGFCRLHWGRVRRYGTPFSATPESKICYVEGCQGKVVAKGMCRKHYSRMYSKGTLDITKDMSGLPKKYPQEYLVLLGMKKRCHNKNDPAYKDYGERGIKICDRWLGVDGFKNFLGDMGTRPAPEYSIDRIDVNGNYCPENCRWATRGQQSNNRRSNVLISKNGETHTLAEWAKILGIGYWTLHSRYKRRGAQSSILYKSRKMVN